MRAIAIKIKKQKSKVHKGVFYFLFLKGEDGKSYRTHISPAFGNWARWEKIVTLVASGQRVRVDGLVVKKGRIIDADSFVRILE